ncbi:hypothetical protein ACHAXR_010703 [Thalassiosira sp. AJA248-18]
MVDDKISYLVRAPPPSLSPLTFTPLPSRSPFICPMSTSTSIMAASTETVAADMQAELHRLRQKNKELQSQLEQLTLAHKRELGAVSQNDNGKEGTASSSSSLDGALDLRASSLDSALDLRERCSVSLDGNLHNGLHQRHVSGKENTARDYTHVEHNRSSSLVTPKRQKIKSKVSDVDFIHTPKKNGHGNSVPNSPKRSGSTEEDGFVNECNNVNHSPNKGKGTKKSSDGGGRYYKALSIDHGDEEEGQFPGMHSQHSSESDDGDSGDEIEDLLDDDSHHKHAPRITPGSPCSATSSSNSFPSFHDQIKERAGWLIGLLFLQSCSSFIIQYNQKFLQSHMVIVQFLTMLVGAGGNAGNQASVRVIRSLAVGTLNRHTMRYFLKQEAKMALALSGLIGMTGFIRAALFRTPPGETIAVTTSVCAIVAISVAIGSTLPLGMKRVGIDPAHSSTSIQVIMDILGVLITVCVSSFVLRFFDDRAEGVEGSDDSLL